MAGHTPGPWEVMGPWPSINVCVCVDAGCTHPDCPSPPEYEPVCAVFQSWDYKTEASDEVKANARLIAAAPDLLAEVIRLREIVGRFATEQLVTASELADALESSQSAIRKATSNG